MTENVNIFSFFLKKRFHFLSLNLFSVFQNFKILEFIS